MGATWSGNNDSSLSQKHKEASRQNYLYPIFCKSWPGRSHYFTLFQKYVFRSDVWLPFWPELKFKAETFFFLSVNFFCNLSFINASAAWITSIFYLQGTHFSCHIKIKLLWKISLNSLEHCALYNFRRQDDLKTKCIRLGDDHETATYKEKVTYLSLETHTTATNQMSYWEGGGAHCKKDSDYCYFNIV